MVLYKVDMSQPGVSTQALEKGFAEHGNEVRIVLPPSENMDQNEWHIKRAWLEGIPYFRDKFAFESKQSLIDSEQSELDVIKPDTTVLDHKSLTSESTEVVAEPAVCSEPAEEQAIVENIQGKHSPELSIELLGFSGYCFGKLFVPWLYRGISISSLPSLSVYGWARSVYMMDYLQAGAITEQITKQLANETSKVFSWWPIEDIDENSRPWYSQTVDSYKCLEDLPARYVIVHNYAMALEGGEAEHLSEWFQEVQRIAPNFAQDLVSWQLALPVAHLCDCMSGRHRWRAPEDLACRADKILMPLLFATESLPDDYKPLFVKEGEDVRKSVRDFLRMNFN